VRKALLRAGAAVALAVVVLAGAELAVRAAGYSAPFWTRPDPQLGWRLRPGTQGWFIKEGRNFARVSDAGWRDRDHTLDKPEHAYRIALLGDEHSEAMQVPLDASWWSLIAPRLEQCGVAPGKRIEVLNFGVTGYGTAQEAVLLETDAMRYRPDLVLVQFSAGNDVQNNSFALAEEKDRPFFLRDARGALHIDGSFNAGPRFVARSQISHELARKLGDHSRAFQLASMIPEGALMPRAHAAPGYQGALLAPPRDAQWEEAWEVTEGLLGQMRDYAKRNGAKFALVVVPDAIQVTPDAMRRESAQARLGVHDLFYPDRRVETFARRSGILAVTLGPEMLAEKKPLYFRSLWNEEGSRVAAGLIARKLCSAGL
jgi:hypothetical protein